MTDLYLAIKWLHIVAACIAFGSNVTHFFWLLAANANTDPAQRSGILRIVKKIDDWLAVPAYTVVVVSGASMWLWQWPLHSSWLMTSLALTTILTLMGISYGPFMKRWMRLAADAHADGGSLAVLTHTLTIWWGAIILTVPFILYCMVWKPMLW